MKKTEKTEKEINMEFCSNCNKKQKVEEIEQMKHLFTVLRDGVFFYNFHETDVICKKCGAIIRWYNRRVPN